MTEKNVPPPPVDDLVDNLRLFSTVWGDLPSIPPHPAEAPGFTTGMVIRLANAAADRIQAAESQLSSMRKALEAIANPSAVSGMHDQDGAPKLQKIARAALTTQETTHD